MSIAGTTTRNRALRKTIVAWNRYCPVFFCFLVVSSPFASLCVLAHSLDPPACPARHCFVYLLCGCSLALLGFSSASFLRPSSSSYSFLLTPLPLPDCRHDCAVTGCFGAVCLSSQARPPLLPGHIAAAAAASRPAISSSPLQVSSSRSSSL